MSKDVSGRKQNRFMYWWHATVDDWFFRSFIGPGQVENAIHGADKEAREYWKRDLEARKRYTREQRERKLAAREDQDRD